MPVTIHLPLREIFAHLRPNSIVETGRIVARDLAARFRHCRARASRSPGSIRMPAKTARWARRIAHRRAGRRAARRRRHRRARARCRPTRCSTSGRARGYDAALCMYHDQALIPIKTLDFDHARQRHARPALRAHLARSRHRLRHRRQGRRRSDEPDRGAAAGGAACQRPTARAPADRVVTERSDGLPPLREVIRRHGLVAKKSLGQNFLLDLNLTAPHRARGGTARRRDVIEIGPGPGGLTRALLAARRRTRHRRRARRARHRGAARVRRGTIPAGSTSSQADALRFDPRPRSTAGRVRIVANLPYNIATALLIGWLAPSPGRLVRCRRSDVPARGRRAHRRRAAVARATGGSRCWRSGAARRDPVRREPVRLRAAAESHLIGGAADAAPDAAAMRSRAPRERHASRLRPAPQDAASKPALARRRCAGAADRRRHQPDGAGRGHLRSKALSLWRGLSQRSGVWA